MQVYTLGYQGLSIEHYLRALRDAGVEMVIDVRENAWSQRSEYIGSLLKRSLADAGIMYQHWKMLGNPAANRKSALNASQCLRRYRAYLNDDSRALNLLLAKIEDEWHRDRKVSLTCYENNPVDCHRSVIVDELKRLRQEIVVVNLEPDILRHRARQSGRKRPSLTTTAFLSPGFLPLTETG